MKENLDIVKSLARDLRDDKESPRMPRETLAGYALATRAVDKCRAVLVGWEGEYISNCPLDQRWLRFAGVDYEAFKSVVATGATDEEIAHWIDEHARNRPKTEIDEWNTREGGVRIS